MARAAPDEASPTPQSGGYVAPPTLTGASREPDAVLVRGRAAAGSRVLITSPSGLKLELPVGADGAWSARLPAGAEPAMYALSMQVGARTVRAEGALMTLPAPAYPALLARAGAASLPAPAKVAAPRIVSIDFDAVGSAAVGGLAPPGSRVQLAADGQAADIDQADSAGRFALTGPRTRPLASGAHRFTVSSPQGSDEAEVSLRPSTPLTGGPLRATRDPVGWRIDWALPGGGVQSTLVLERAGR